MTLDNTPAEFINGGGDYDGDYDDYDDYDDESDEEELRTDHESTSEDREEQYRFREGWVEYLISTDCVPFVEEDGRVVRMEHGIVYLDDVDGSPLAAFVADNVRVGFDPEELATGKHREFETFKSSTPATA
jgi:hypothetical protein